MTRFLKTFTIILLTITLTVTFAVMLFLCAVQLPIVQDQLHSWYANYSFVPDWAMFWSPHCCM